MMILLQVDVHQHLMTSIQLMENGASELAMVEPMDLSSPFVVNARSSPNAAQRANSETSSNDVQLSGNMLRSRPVGAISSPGVTNNVNFLTTSDYIRMSSTINDTDVVNNLQFETTSDFPLLFPSMPTLRPFGARSSSDVAYNVNFVATTDSTQLPGNMQGIATNAPGTMQGMATNAPGTMQGIAISAPDAANNINMVTAQLPSTSPVGARSSLNVPDKVNLTTRSTTALLPLKPVVVRLIDVYKNPIQPSAHEHHMMQQHSSYNKDHQYSRPCVSEQHNIQQYNSFPITSSTSDHELNEEEPPPSVNAQTIMQILPNGNIVQIPQNENGQNMQTFSRGDAANAPCQITGQALSVPSKPMGDQQVHSQPADTTSPSDARLSDRAQPDGAHSDGAQSEAHEHARPETSSANLIKMEVLAGPSNEHADQLVTEFDEKLKQVSR